MCIGALLLIDFHLRMNDIRYRTNATRQEKKEKKRKKRN